MLRQLTFKVSDTRDLQTWLQSSNRYNLVDVFSHESKPLALLLSPEEKVQASVAFFFFFFLLFFFFLGGGGGGGGGGGCYFFWGETTLKILLFKSAFTHNRKLKEIQCNKSETKQI